MDVTVCTFDGCDRPPHSRNLCTTHYERWRLGRPMVCVVDGCAGGPVRKSERCQRHHAAYGAFTEALRMRPCRTGGCTAAAEHPWRLCARHYTDALAQANCCTSEGCPRPAHTRGGLCAVHYERVLLARHAGTAAACVADGCDEQARVRGLCGRHYSGRAAPGALPPRTYTCDSCGRAVPWRRSRAERTRCQECVIKAAQVPPGDRTCRHCGAAFVYHPAAGMWQRVYCSDACKDGEELKRWRSGQYAYPELTARVSALRRARERQQFVEKVHPAVVFERDGWVCWICQRPVDKAAPRNTRWGATLDHVVPLARGGEHSYDNVRLAHLCCNSRKGASLLGVSA